MAVNLRNSIISSLIIGLRQSVTGGLRGLLAALDLQFAATKTLTDQISGNELITFTRASAGTYVDNNGVIQTARVNKNTYSQDYTRSVYGKTRVTIDNLTSDNTSPTGEYRNVIPTAVFNTHVLTFPYVHPANTDCVVSCYVKDAGFDKVQLRVGSIGSDSAIVSFDLTNQQKTLPDGTSGTSSTGVNWNILDSDITDEGNGWFRVLWRSMSTVDLRKGV